MKNLFLKSGIIVSLILRIATSHAYAQDEGEITESYLLSEYFNEVFGADERLVTGPFYYGATRGSIQGHPYYFDEEWKAGSVEIGDTRFDNLSLKYDILINQVILKYVTSTNATYQVGLRSGNITRINIGYHTFVPFPGRRDTTAIPYAELLSDGEIRYMITKTKNLVLTNGSGMTDYSYKESTRQYLYYDNQLIPFRVRGTLLKLFPGLKTELKQFARKNNLQLGIKKYQDRARWVDQCNYLLNKIE